MSFIHQLWVVVIIRRQKSQRWRLKIWIRSRKTWRNRSRPLQRHHPGLSFFEGRYGTAKFPRPRSRIIRHSLLLMLLYDKLAPRWWMSLPPKQKSVRSSRQTHVQIAQGRHINDPCAIHHERILRDHPHMIPILRRCECNICCRWKFIVSHQTIVAEF